MILEGSNFMCLLHSSRPNISTPQNFPRGLVRAGLSTCCNLPANLIALPYRSNQRSPRSKIYIIYVVCIDEGLIEIW